MFWSIRKIIISTGHELHHPHYAHFYCYFSHRLGIERVNALFVRDMPRRRHKLVFSCWLLGTPASNDVTHHNDCNISPYSISNSLD